MITFRPEHLAPLEGRRVLDLGAGGGRHAAWLRDHGALVVAGDLVVEPTERGGVDWVRLDGSALPFADGSFDVVLCAEVLEHVAHPAQVVREARRVLAPGGQLVVSVPSAWPEAVCWALSLEYHGVPGGHVRIWTLGGIRRLLEAEGFRVVARHRRHALHAPYWWARCLLGVERSGRDPRIEWLGWRLVKAAVGEAPLLARLETLLDPVLGKSLVLYAEAAPC